MTEFSRPEFSAAFDEVLERDATVFEALAKHDAEGDDSEDDDDEATSADDQ